ncbi:MAG: hypothetical protein GY755_15265 [Chloroflexi bacterium]|nr:hypothetical protein [Chloroflexota bacterium]
MKYIKKIYPFIILVLLVLALSACGGQTVAEVEATAAAAAEEIDSDAIFTAAVEKVMAQLTETALSFSPTPLPATATPTLIPPTATLVDLNSTPLPTVAIGTPPTLAAGAPTLTPFPTATQVTLGITPDGPICDEMTYGSPIDVNYPDNTEVPAGKNFQKIWRVYNTGVCTWDDGYHLVPIASTSTRSGDNNPLDAANPAWEFNKKDRFTAPGAVADIGVHLTAPLHNGEYSTTFILRNDQGYNFGGPLTVIIKVTDGK